MKAVTYHGRRDVRVEEVPDPAIQLPTDAIIRVTSSGICGSDLHLYEVLGPYMDEGYVLGHEPMGIVQEVGAEVTHIKPGDRVVIPFNIACGHCFMCDQGLMSQCETTQVHDYERGAALFGFTKMYGNVPGGQAEFLRVPQAQFGPIKVPEGDYPDDRFLYLSDVLPTAWQAVQYAGLRPGQTIAVVGLGPIGDMSCRIARHLGAERVIALDLVPERLDRAYVRGDDAFDVSSGDDVVQAVRELTNGRGPDCVIDAVGMEAHGAPIGKLAQDITAILPDALSRKMIEKAGVDRLSALHLAIELVRRGGTISIIGVYGGMVDPIPMDTLFDKQVQLRMGQANVKRWVDDIMPLLTRDDDPLGVDQFATHHVSLDEAPKMYEQFQKKQDGAIKVVLKP
jgi:threonine dehydrogenase-like Zn-dependent dehydrogenase